MSSFNGIGFGGDARRAHLALVQGGGDISTNATRGATGALAPTATAKPSAPRDAAATRFGGTIGAASTQRSRHETGVRAVAQQFTNFDEALLPMVLASGVSGEAAASVADAIRRNPALKAQAERAYQRARLNAV